MVLRWATGLLQSLKAIHKGVYKSGCRSQNKHPHHKNRKVVKFFCAWQGRNYLCWTAQKYVQQGYSCSYLYYCWSFSFITALEKKRSVKQLSVWAFPAFIAFFSPFNENAIDDPFPIWDYFKTSEHLTYTLGIVHRLAVWANARKRISTA